MLTSLALCLAPAVAPQDAADLHLAEAGLYLDVPNLPAFSEAWRSGAIMQLLEDEDLGPMLGLFGIEHVSDLMELLPAEIVRDTLPILEGIEGISLSLQLDMSKVGELVAEGAVVYDVLLGLDALDWDIFMYELDEGGPPEELAELDREPSELLDPFGHPYLYTVSDGVYELSSLGADGVPGGSGLDADWSTDSGFEQYVLARVFEVVGVELAVRFVDDELAGGMAGMLGMIDGRLRDEVPFTDVIDMNGDAPELANLYHIDPVNLGMPSGGGLLEASLQQHGRTLLITLGTVSGEAVHRVGQAALSGQASPESLGGAGRLDQLLGAVHDDAGAVLWQGAVLGFRGVPTEGMLAESLANVSSLFEFFGFYGTGSAWQTRLVDGTYQSDSTRPANGATPYPLDGSAAWIPNDALFAQITSLDPVAFWGYVTEVTTGEEELIELLLERGIDLEGDLIANFGGEIAFWMQPVLSLAPPQVYGVMPVRNGEAVMATLDGLCDFAAEMEPDFGVSHRPYRGNDYTVLDLGVPIGFSPSYTIIDGNLWFSNSSTLIKRMIRQRSKGEEYERGAHPFFASLVGEDGKLPADIHDAYYFDIGAMLSAYYGTGRAFAAMVPAELGLPEGFAAALPDPELFSRHFLPETSVTRFRGDHLFTRKVSSFGPEVPLIVGGAAAALIPTVFLGTTESMSPEVVWTEPEYAGQIGLGGARGAPLSTEASMTEVNLSLVDLGLLIYNLENGDYPAKLEDLVSSTSSYPEGYLNMSEVPVDGWGRSFYYERVSASEYHIRSFGPNGTDDGGAGDDLTP
ncbi:MAG: type II secretion system protein GspG [Planctomycetota bacterium]|nr:type II secretion system protein GspG [Planctomycetota bacterium]